jgi:HPt (histidine-containing phosphotransfer) domain-containing protein/PAS domain-containing protein
MNSRLAKALGPLLTPAGSLVLVVVLGLSFVAVVLVPGLKLAGEVADSSTALKFLGEQRRHPTVIRAALESIHDRLGSRGYIQESLDQLRASQSQLDAALHEMTVERPASWFALTADTAAKGGPMAGKHAAMLLDIWAKELVVLNPVLAFRGVPYQDNEATGTNLNDGGRQLERDVDAALRTSRRTVPELNNEFAAIASELESANERSAIELKLVMVTGLVIALGLVVLVALLMGARQRQDSSLRQARQQTADILRTVKDGLFLLDRNLVIGSAYSSALESLFHRKDFAGLAFENLLKKVVSERTLATALKFVKVLWAERTNEKLVKAINPLGEVEVHLDCGNGRFDTRYLQFDFHRVRLDGEMTHVLVSVSDVTARVDLAKELQASQSQAQGQVDTLLGILHIEPSQLQSFLNDSNAAMKMINAVLREPTREEGVFRKKLDTLFRQAHAVKGEAAALGLSSIESRAHAFEEDLKALRERPTLSGNDFLPLVIKLDDLLTHLQTVGDLVSRLSRLQITHSDVVHAKTDVLHEEEAVGGGSVEAGVTGTLQRLAARVAGENGKEAILHCTGLDAVPDDYRRAIKDIGIQAVRNAIVHGVEAPAARSAAGKSTQGAVRLSFQDLGDAGYKLVVEDDGQGVSTERIREVALKKGFITPERAQTLDTKQIFALLFQPGFSTIESATLDAGRGVGMNLIAELVNQMGGRVSVATAAGKFTRLTMTLPRAGKRVDDTEAA